MSQKLTKPNYGRAILEPVNDGQKQVGNIIIPDMGQEKAQIGVILEICPIYNYNLGELSPIPYEVGDTVVFSPMAAQKVTIDRNDFLIVSINDIGAKITE